MANTQQPRAQLARKLHHVAIITLIVLSVAIFSKALSYQFVSTDDGLNIYENPDVAALDWPHIKAMFTNIKRAHRWLPLGWMSYAVDQHFFGLSPFTYHFGNMLLHALNGVLVYFLFRRLLKAAVGKQAFDEKPLASVTGPALAALMWLMNPMRVEPVAWSSARIYLVSCAFFFSSLLAYLRSAKEETEGRSGVRWHWLSVVALTASLLTYPMAIFGVWIFILLEFFPLRRVPMMKPWRAPREAWLRLIPFMTVSAVLFALMLWHNHLIPQTLSDFDPPRSFGTPAHKVMQAFFVWAYFAWKPWIPLNLSPSYPTLLSFEPFSAPFIASLIAIVSLTVWLYRRRAAWPAVWIAWLAHLGFLVPLLGLAEIRYSPGDRYSYVVAVIPMALLAGTIWKFWERSWMRPVLASSAALLITFTCLSWSQLDVWQNRITFRECISRRAGDTVFRPYMDAMLGATYFADGSNQLAAAASRAALARCPDLAFAILNLGDVAQAEGNLDEAIARYDEVLKLKPEWLIARVNRGVALGKQGKLEESAAVFHAILEVDPKHSGARQNLAFAFEQQGRTNDARLVLAGRLPN